MPGPVPLSFDVTEALPADATEGRRAEPSCYRASPDVTLHILPRSAHCQTFAATRRRMWDRMHHWSRWIASNRN